MLLSTVGSLLAPAARLRAASFRITVAAAVRPIPHLSSEKQVGANTTVQNTGNGYGNSLSRDYLTVIFTVPIQYNSNTSIL